jgi:hypothetical protein
MDMMPGKKTLPDDIPEIWLPAPADGLLDMRRALTETEPMKQSLPGLRAARRFLEEKPADFFATMQLMEKEQSQREKEARERWQASIAKGEATATPATPSTEKLTPDLGTARVRELIEKILTGGEK